MNDSKYRVRFSARMVLLALMLLTIFAPAVGATVSATETVACATIATPEASPQAQIEASESAQKIEFDLIFIDLMVPHHEGAIAMARVAQQRGNHQEILDLAEDILTSQGGEVEQMLAWRGLWYPDAPTLPADDLEAQMSAFGADAHNGAAKHGTEMSGMDPTSDAEFLCATPEPFDLAFINLMIPHHQSAIEMATIALQQATHPEIEALAHAVIEAQKREIVQMEAWRVAWYGTPVPA